MISFCILANTKPNGSLVSPKMSLKLQNDFYGKISQGNAFKIESVLKKR